MREKRLRALIMLFLIVSITISFTSYRVDSRILVQSNFLQEGQGYAITGSHGGGVLGSHFDYVGDVNGDGIDDFIIGEPYWGSSAGKGSAYLFLGRLDASWDELTLADAQASFIAEASGGWFGRWTAGLGDIDGNGYADFAVSDQGNDEAGHNAGKLYVFLGGSDVSWTMDTPASQSNVSITGEATGDLLGHGVYGIGDTNGDGYDDFIVSGMRSDEGGSDAGQLYLFLGRPHGQWLDTYSAADANASWIGTTGDLLSLDASGVGDVNNDGFADFAVGAWS
ncbi:MAG: FG-GAP repeat protein, partial [Candidatus Thorarchaeota archaeon]|nr:FG-GAP repeat protein [Candidatus Thorarchaeota archaeon]